MKDIELNNLEEYIPLLAEGVFQKAYLDTLASGNSVFEVIDDSIYEVFANGDKKKIKDIEPSIKIDISKKITFK
jgi:hypothetical protein